MVTMTTGLIQIFCVMMMMMMKMINMMKMMMKIEESLIN